MCVCVQTCSRKTSIPCVSLVYLAMNREEIGAAASDINKDLCPIHLYFFSQAYSLFYFLTFFLNFITMDAPPEKEFLLYQEMLKNVVASEVPYTSLNENTMVYFKHTASTVVYMSICLTCSLWQLLTAIELVYRVRKWIHFAVLSETLLSFLVILCSVLNPLTSLNCEIVGLFLLSCFTCAFLLLILICLEIEILDIHCVYQSRWLLYSVDLTL